MSFQILGPDPLEQQIARMLERLDEGQLPAQIETAQVDVKEESGRHRGRIRWRVGDNCVEVDAATWHSGRLHRSGFDWSAQPSGHTLENVRLQAVEVARRYLRQRGDASAVEMAEVSPFDLIHA